MGYSFFGNPSRGLQTAQAGGDNRRMREESQGLIVGPATELEAATSSRSLVVYVPRRFRIGGIEGIPTGAAIVGTPQADGMVAIDVESEPDVEPNPEVWSNWIADAAGRHTAEVEGGGGGQGSQTRLVSEAALVEVGQFIKGHVSINDAGAGAAISRWIQTGRADYVVDVPFPHEA